MFVLGCCASEAVLRVERKTRSNKRQLRSSHHIAISSIPLIENAAGVIATSNPRNRPVAPGSSTTQRTTLVSIVPRMTELTYKKPEVPDAANTVQVIS